jgi:hypothetical protein
MFFLGSTGSVLPYVLSLIALWSGFFLGYGQYLSVRKAPSAEKVVAHEDQQVKNEKTCNYTDYSKITNTRNNKDFSKDLLSIPDNLIIRHSLVEFIQNEAEVYNSPFCINFPSNRGSPLFS